MQFSHNFSLFPCKMLLDINSAKSSKSLVPQFRWKLYGKPQNHIKTNPWSIADKEAPQRLPLRENIMQLCFVQRKKCWHQRSNEKAGWHKLLLLGNTGSFIKSEGTFCMQEFCFANKLNSPLVSKWMQGLGPSSAVMPCERKNCMCSEMVRSLALRNTYSNFNHQVHSCWVVD